MSETFLSVAIIGALLGGLAGLGTAAVQIIKALFSKNSNKELEYAHTERMIELLSKQNDSSEKTLAALEGLRDDVGSLKQELGGLNERVLKLEERQLKS